MSIGTTIKKLRRERDMTQEQLAEYLGVTANAVSQWECDRTAPDISQLPLLVRIFNVTADELLEINLANKELEITELHDKVYELTRIGRNKDAFEFARNAYKRYPDSYDLMYAYASSFCYVVYDNSYTAEEKEVFRAECMKLLENIAEGCTEEHLRQHAMSNLCWMYRDCGQLEKAEEIVEKFPILINSREFLRTGLYGGSKEIKVTRSLLYVLIEHLSNRMIRNCRTDSGEWYYSEKEMCELYQKQLAFLGLMFENGDYGFYYSDVWEAHKNIAAFYAQQNDTEKTLLHLEAAVKAIIRYLHDFYKKKYTYTSLLFKNYEDSGEEIWYSSNDNDAAELLMFIQEEKFDFLRGNERFKTIVEQLNSYRGTWEA